MGDLRSALRSKIIVYDGSKGTMLQMLGLKGGEIAEVWNLEHPEKIRSILMQYRQAGAEAVQTCTFQSLKLGDYGLEERIDEINLQAAKLAREAVGEEGFVLGDVGPTGILFQPSGPLTFNEAYNIFARQVKIFDEAGVDGINFETFTDLAEMRAALIAAKENSTLPVICSMAFEAGGRTLMGSSPKICALVLKSLGADMVGSNCSLGPKHLLDIIREMSTVGGIPLMAKPNAGLPQYIDGKVVYQEGPEVFEKLSGEFVKFGVTLIGGCCGTTPEHIEAIRRGVENLTPSIRPSSDERLICSATEITDLDQKNLNIGFMERNMENDFQSALTAGDEDYFIDAAMDTAEEDYDAVVFRLDVPASAENYEKFIDTIQTYLKAPLIFDTTCGSVDGAVLETVLRHYQGRAAVRIKNQGSLLSVAEKYGALVI